MDSYKMFINGESVDAIGGKTMPLVDPGTGETFATVPCGDERDVEAAVAATEAVHAHVDARSQFPCSWLQVRIQYAGSGEQACGSLMDLFKVVGALDTKNETMIKHIKEASELRRNA